MAEMNAPNTRRWRWPWGLLRDGIVSTAVAFGLDAWVKDWVKGLFAQHIGPIAGNVIKDKLTNDKRAELLEDFRIMRVREKKNIDNLIQRHEKSMKQEKHMEEPSVNNPPEYLFVELLCKIPHTKKRGRRDMLIYLNNLSDDEFYQMLYLLEHDVVIQWIGIARRTGRKITHATVKELKNLVGCADKTIGAGFKETFRRLDQAAAQAAPTLGLIADQLAAARKAGY
jgi:hypothetical protein